MNLMCVECAEMNHYLGISDAFFIYRGFSLCSIHYDDVREKEHQKNLTIIERMK